MQQPDSVFLEEGGVWGRGVCPLDILLARAGKLLAWISLQYMTTTSLLMKGMLNAEWIRNWLL